MKKFPYYTKSHFASNLTSIEKQSVLAAFPNANVDGIRKLAPRDRFEEQGKQLPKYCNLYGCDLTSKAIEINGVLKPVSAEVCKKINCIDINMVSISYNCIGWALGIRDWIDTDLISAFVKKKGSISEGINSFIALTNKTYSSKNPDNYEKNILRIIDKLKSPDKGCEKNNIETDIITKTNKINIVSFYFKDVEGTHAARYVDYIGNNAINSWTSKLGDAWLISHKFNDLSDISADAGYGIPLCYAEYISDTLHQGNFQYDLKDEL